MTLTLRVDRDAWEANVRDVAARYGDILAVVKGNGYGFGLSALATAAVGLGFQPLAVGTVYELDALPALTEPPVVLTPVLGPTRRRSPRCSPSDRPPTWRPWRGTATSRPSP